MLQFSNSYREIESETNSKNIANQKNRLSKEKTDIKIKRLMLFFLLMSFTTFSFAQDNYQDVVYLKNGSIIRGIIIEQIPNKSIKIETSERNVFVYQMDEIEKIAKELNQLKISDKTIKYKGIIDLGVQFGVGNLGVDRLKFDFINGAQINPYFSLGLGTGFRYYHPIESWLIPLFTDFRINFMDKMASPFFSLGIGYSFDATYNFEGVGLLFNPSAGVSFKSRKTAVYFALTYELQRLITVNLSAIGIGLGISF